jgi:putative oxidoreductase
MRADMSASPAFGEKQMSILANFDPTNGFNILRIMCGVFFIPHIFGKYTEREFTIGFFTKAGLVPPEPFIYVSLAIETVVATALIFGIMTRYAALLAAVFMLCATAAVYRVSGGRWFWNLGGYEYTLFWALACVVVAIEA